MENKSFTFEVFVTRVELRTRQALTYRSNRKKKKNALCIEFRVLIINYRWERFMEKRITSSFFFFAKNRTCRHYVKYNYVK